MKGRKPKPTALRLLEGNPGHRTIRTELEPRPPSVRPPRPKILTGEARRHWNYLIKQQQLMGTLGKSDQATIMAAALAFAQACELKREIESLEKIDRGWSDIPDELRLKITVAAEKELASKRRLFVNTANALVRYEAELGSNPSARTRIRLEAPKHQSLRERLLS